MPNSASLGKLANKRSAKQQRAAWRDYYEMTKPNVVLLLLLTALVGMCLASDTWIPAQTLIVGLFGIGALSSAAAVVNHVVDHEIDSKMARTFNRPVAKGRVTSKQALTFAFILGVLGFVALDLWINQLTAILTLAGLVGYAGIYTLFLKRATPQNIVIGGLAGAIPPLLGWTAVTGQIHAYPLLLVLIIFTWTPPHFGHWQFIVKKTTQKQKYRCYQSHMVLNIPKRSSCYIRYCCS